MACLKGIACQRCHSDFKDEECEILKPILKKADP